MSLKQLQLVSMETGEQSGRDGEEKSGKHQHFCGELGSVASSFGSFGITYWTTSRIYDSQLLPSDLLFPQMEVTYPLKRSLKTPKRVIGKNLEYDIPDLGLRLVTSAASHGVES